METNPRAQEAKSTDSGLEALKREMEEIVRSDKIGPSAFDWDDEPMTSTVPSSDEPVKPTISPPSIEPAPPPASQPFTFRKAHAWSLIALLGIVGLGASVLGWSYSKGHSAQPTSQPVQVASAPVPAAGVEAKPAAAPAAPPARLPDDSNPAQSVVRAQAAPKLPEQTAAGGTEIMQSLQSLERRLTNLEQGIEKIRDTQAKLTGANAELVNDFKQAQEKLAASVGDLASELRAAEARDARERAAAAEQLRLNQEQLAKINEQLKANQEQIERRKAAAAPSQRLVGVTPPQQPTSTASTAPKPRLQQQTSTASTAPKPAPKPAPVQARAGTTPASTTSPPAR